MDYTPCSTDSGCLRNKWTQESKLLKGIISDVSDFEDRIYGEEGMEIYISRIFQTLQKAMRPVTPISTFDELELEIETTVSVNPRPVESNNTNELKMYVQTHKNALFATENFYRRLREVFQTMELHCGEYSGLNPRDVDYYEQLNLDILSAKSTLERMDNVFDNVRGGKTISEFTMCAEVNEICLIADCELFPVLRLLPDIFDSLRSVSTVCQDWMRSDNVFIEQLESETDRLNHNINQQELKLQRLDTQHRELYSALKAIFTEYGYDFSTEMAEVQQQLEAMNGFDNNSCVLKSVRARLSELQGISLEVTQLKKSIGRCGKLKSRTSESLRLSKMQLEKFERLLVLRKDKILAFEATDNVDNYKNTTRRRKSLESGLCDTDSNVNLNTKPREKLRRRSLDDGLPIVISHDVAQFENIETLPKPAQKKRLTRRPSSVELQKAFRIVKNNIGHGWKELARSLPYWNEKRMSELESDITQIEYQYRGDLKEQALQSLLAWYFNNGKRSSVSVLCETLRHIDQTRLAEKIEEGDYASFLPDI